MFQKTASLIALSLISLGVHAFEPVNDLSSQWLAHTSAAPSYSSNGAARQGWINGLDGWFNEEWHIGGSWRNNKTGASDTYTGFAHAQKRLTRRIAVGIDLPFVVNNANGDETNIGDFGLTVKGMLYETQDTSISIGIDTYFPTGDGQLGGNTWRVSPHLDVFQDLGQAFSFQGGIILDILPESNTNPDTAITGKFGFGRTMTSHNALLGDFTPHLITTVKVPLDNSANNDVYVSLTPGIRTHVAGGYFLLGLEVPVVSQKAFEHQLTFMYIRGF